MSWRDLVEVEEQDITAPWTGGRSLRYHSRTYVISGRLPSEHGWYRFKVRHKEAKFPEAAEPNHDGLTDVSTGFLVGDRFIPEQARSCDLDYGLIARQYKKVHLIEAGLDLFSRVEVGKVTPFGNLIYKGITFPLGPEEEVLSAFLDQVNSINNIKGVTPALEAAFEAECTQRRETEQRRIELERLRIEEEARLAQEQRRAEMAESLGDGAGRRQMATVDFQEAARAALAIGGAELLDVRDGRRVAEKVVRYRLEGRRFECVCDLQMRIIDAGVCLTDESTGEKGDTFFTLESLPGVIKQAIREGVLVVFRHV